MAFFPRAVADPTSFHPLFRLLDEFEKYSGEGNERNKTGDRNRSRTGHSQLSHWQPRFDVRETADAYELYGELPGVAKQNVSIDFPEPQNILIHGSLKRSYASSANSDDSSSKNAIAEGENQEQSSNKNNVIVKSEQPATKEKYWLSERLVGEFSRNFNFPTAVDVEAVKASLQDGILAITVPKAKKPEARRITIN
jgi:HSP20 family molecular chaperone IbpA